LKDKAFIVPQYINLETGISENDLVSIKQAYNLYSLDNTIKLIESKSLFQQKMIDDYYKKFTVL